MIKGNTFRKKKNEEGKRQKESWTRELRQERRLLLFTILRNFILRTVTIRNEMVQLRMQYVMM